MDSHWLKSLSNLQEQFKGLSEVEKFFEADYQWIDEVVTEATSLFKKNSTQTNSQIDDEENEDDSNNASDNVAPVLLPTTPRVRNFSTFSSISSLFFNVSNIDVEQKLTFEIKFFQVLTVKKHCRFRCFFRFCIKILF